MADAGIKRIVIRQSELPPINSAEEKYILRFRVVSEDRNRTSHWSPQYLLSPTALEFQDNSGISLSSANGMISVSWDTAPGSTQSYDVWVAYGTNLGSTGIPEYKATVSGNYITLPIPAGKVSAQVFIQNLSVPRVSVIPALVIAQTGIEDLSVV
jgi:hypothetical protein|tara:strand:- start:140 stop:604 length:465 start_codon:yes stop_codon:yes gene_type:complete